jgi:hypothetical protein
MQMIWIEMFGSTDIRAYVHTVKQAAPGEAIGAARRKSSAGAVGSR